MDSFLLNFSSFFLRLLFVWSSFLRHLPSTRIGDFWPISFLTDIVLLSLDFSVSWVKRRSRPSFHLSSTGSPISGSNFRLQLALTPYSSNLSGNFFQKIRRFQIFDTESVGSYPQIQQSIVRQSPSRLGLEHRTPQAVSPFLEACKGPMVCQWFRL